MALDIHYCSKKRGGREYSVKTLDQSKIKNKLKKMPNSVCSCKISKDSADVHTGLLSFVDCKKNVSLGSIYFPVNSFVPVAKVSHC